MSGRLAGKTAVVTAAAQGIGRATALAFAREGAAVWAIDLSGAKLAELEGTARLQSLELDVTDGPLVRRAAARMGAVDALVNAVGWAHQGTLLDTEEADWDRSFEINIRSMYLTTRAFLPGMLERGGGSIVNIASVASSLSGVPNRCAYSATKGAVIGFTKSVAADYMRRGIRCNAICPGTVHTPSLEERIAALPDPTAARAAFIARQPVGRLGKADEIAELCVYLACDASAFMIGAELIIDGGMTL